MTIDIITGHDLPDTLIDMMNRQRIHEYQVNTKNFRQNEQDSTFFFVRADEEVKAFGMLKPVVLIYQGQPTSILGIGNIIARDKGTGQGRQLMTAIREYLTTKGRIGLGFCKHQVAGFYQACGYQVVDGLSGRFRYSLAYLSDERDILTHSYHTLCHDPIGGFIESLQASDDCIYSNQPFW